MHPRLRITATRWALGCRCALAAMGLFVGASLHETAPAYAESFVLKNGGRIEGDLLNPKRNVQEPYQVRTAEGVRLSLGKELVAKVVIKREQEREYDRLLPKVPDTAAGHLAMAQWCKDAVLKPQREHHLQEVIARDPTNEPAHQALGYQRFDGEWQRPEDHMAAQGYVKHQGAWRSKQEVELAKQQSAVDAEVIEWRQQIRIWRSWIGKKREAEGVANLRGIRDPRAVPTLIDLLNEKDTSADLRLLIIDVLSEIPGNLADGVFIKLAMTDGNRAIRDACLDQLVRTQSKPAVFQFIGLLKNDKNELVQRSAAALGRLNDTIAAPALMESLVTTHEILITPGSQSSGGLGPIASSFGNGAGGGVNPGGGAFSAGSAKPVKQKVQSQNDAVLGALTTLFPGVNFGFDTAAWKRWYVQTHEPAKVNLRRGN